MLEWLQLWGEAEQKLAHMALSIEEARGNSYSNKLRENNQIPPIRDKEATTAILTKLLCRTHSGLLTYAAFDGEMYGVYGRDGDKKQSICLIILTSLSRIGVERS